MLIFLFACKAPPSTEKFLTPAEIAEGIEAASHGLLRVDPLLQHRGWTTAMQSYADEQCPAIGEHNGMDYWHESCTTAEGHQFLGWALNFRGVNIVQDEYSYSNFDWLSGQAQIITKDGSLLQNFGDVLHQEGLDSEGNRVVMGFTYGNFYWDDPLAENSWLVSDMSIEYYYTFTQEADDVRVNLLTRYPYGPNGDGSRLNNFDPKYPAAIFEGIIIDTEICDSEPIEGIIWLRDLAGLWYAVAYDSDTACDGCGMATHNTVEIGEVCSDFNMWRDWSEYPWEKP